MTKPAVRYLIASQKGGVGKTTTAANLVAAFSLKGRRVLAIDLDPQGCLGESFGIKRTTPKRGIFDLFIFNRPISSLIYAVDSAKIHLIPSNINSALMEEMLISTTRNRSLLSLKLAEVENDFDYIIIDSPPSMSLLTILGLVTAHRTIIPFQPEPFSLASKNNFFHMMWSVRTSLNPQLGLEGILFTMLDRRLKSANRLIAETKAELKDFVLDTTIPRAIALANAVEEDLPLVMVDKRNQGAQAYLRLADELEKRLKAHPERRMPALPFVPQSNLNLQDIPQI
jgi:chromosome partitioning protein